MKDERGMAGVPIRTDLVGVLRRSVLGAAWPVLGVSLLVAVPAAGALWNEPAVYGPLGALAVAAPIVGIATGGAAVFGAAAGLVKALPDRQGRGIERRASAVMLGVYLASVPACLLIGLVLWAAGGASGLFIAFAVAEGALLATLGGYAVAYLRGAFLAVREAVQEAKAGAALVASEWIDDRLGCWQPDGLDRQGQGSREGGAAAIRAFPAETGGTGTTPEVSEGPSAGARTFREGPAGPSGDSCPGSPRTP
jgi:hypothetical protein